MAHIRPTVIAQRRETDDTSGLYSGCVIGHASDLDLITTLLTSAAFIHRDMMAGVN